MKSFISCRPVAGRLITFAISSFAAVVLGGLVSLPTEAIAQQPNGPQEAAPAMQGTAQASAPASRIADLVKEVERNNPEIAAAYHGWQAATNVPRQAAAFPETQVSVQHFSVGSPRPFAGFSNSDFAYIGIGASQDIPFPASVRCAGKSLSWKRTRGGKIPKPCGGA